MLLHQQAIQLRWKVVVVQLIILFAATLTLAQFHQMQLLLGYLESNDNAGKILILGQ